MNQRQAHAVASSRGEAHKPAETFRHKPGVLLVDDEEMVRHMLQVALESQGFRVWPATNGWEALDLYRRHRQAIAVVLLDVRMPGLDGPQTFDALCNLDADVRVCFMSGDTGSHDAGELLEQGAQHFFLKPFHLEEVVDALQQLVGGGDTIMSAARTPGELQE